jgi:hypothetical protein
VDADVTPDPVDLVADALVERGLAIDPKATRDDATAALNALRAEGLDIVRFAVGYEDPRRPTAECGGCGRRPPPVVVERWPGDDSHLRRST